MRSEREAPVASLGRKSRGCRRWLRQRVRGTGSEGVGAQGARASGDQRSGPRQSGQGRHGAPEAGGRGEGGGALFFRAHLPDPGDESRAISRATVTFSLLYCLALLSWRQREGLVSRAVVALVLGGGPGRGRVLRNTLFLTDVAMLRPLSTEGV